MRGSLGAVISVVPPIIDRGLSGGPTSHATARMMRIAEGGFFCRSTVEFTRAKCRGFSFSIVADQALSDEPAKVPAVSHDMLCDGFGFVAQINRLDAITH